MMANAQTFCLNGGKTFLPADYFSLRYIQSSNSPFQFVIGAYHERSHRNQLHYGAVGVDMMTELISRQHSNAERSFGVSSAIGFCWQAEHEPWLYKDWPFSKRSSLGLVGEVNVQWYLTPAFTLHSFLQQKILFNPHLGRYRLLAGIGIRYRFDHY